MQWGVASPGRGGTITYPLAFSTVYTVVVGARANRTEGLSGSQSCAYVYNANTETFVGGSYDTGNGYQGINWWAVGK